LREFFFKFFSRNFFSEFFFGSLVPKVFFRKNPFQNNRKKKFSFFFGISFAEKLFRECFFLEHFFRKIFLEILFKKKYGKIVFEKNVIQFFFPEAVVFAIFFWKSCSVSGNSFLQTKKVLVFLVTGNIRLLLTEKKFQRQWYQIRPCSGG